MRVRSRVLVALVALISFSASVAEGVWASSCAGAEPGGAMAGMRMPVPADAGPAASSPVDHGRPLDEGGCPLPALLGAGCVVSSLPAPTLQVDLGAADVRDEPVASPALFDRLAVTGLFRPPQR